MSMEEWPDDHLDELFRKSAEEYDVPINNDDWADMSRRLDQLDRQTLFDRISRWGGVGAVVLLLLAGLGWVMYDEKPAGHQQQAVITPGREAAARPAVPDQQRKIGLSDNKGQRTETAGRNVPEQQKTGAVIEAERQLQATQSIRNLAEQKTTQSPDKLLPAETRTKASRSADQSMAAVAGRRPVSVGNRLADSNEKLTNTPVSQRIARPLMKSRNLAAAEKFNPNYGSTAESLANRSTVHAQETYPVPGGNRPGSKAGNRLDEAAETGERTQPAVTEPGADGPWLPALTDALSLSNVVQQAVGPLPAPSLPEVTASAPMQRSVPRLGRLSILLFASPDLSTIGLKNFERPGSNAGLSVQYQLTDRLSINSALMYSTKRYQTYSDDYVLPSNQHIYVLPEEVLGVCKMIDIPLNLRYDWLLRPRGNGRAPARWFASAGLTSYFIQHEVYTYQYANPDDPKVKYQPKGWDNRAAGVPGGSFGFSNLNLSVGYERPISNRLSWQIEPFMKVPLKQVGYFQVKLLSTGAFVGLRYRL